MSLKRQWPFGAPCRGKKGLHEVRHMKEWNCFRLAMIIFFPLALLAFERPGYSEQCTLLCADDLLYQGAFAYPSGDEWAYSGHALA